MSIRIAVFEKGFVKIIFLSPVSISLSSASDPPTTLNSIMETLRVNCRQPSADIEEKLKLVHFRPAIFEHCEEMVHFLPALLKIRRAIIKVVKSFLSNGTISQTVGSLCSISYVTQYLIKSNTNSTSESKSHFRCACVILNDN